MTTTTHESFAVAELSALRKAFILVTVSTCTMLYAATVTIVNVALPQLQGALSATPDQIAWVVTLNVVATAVATPMTGWLVARLGQRRLMLGAVAGFAVTSLLCAVATTLESLLVWRVGQGIFGAPIVPLSQAILLAAYPGRDRAMAQGLFGMAVVIGPAVAPALGGYLAETYDWRWIFYLIIPLCFAAFFLTLAFVHEGGRDESVRLDWTGFLTLSIAIVCLQLIVDRGERLGWLESGEFVIYVCVVALSFYMFAAHTATAKAPFLNVALFTDRNYVVGLVLVLVYGMLNFTPITLLPPMLQGLKGYPDSLIGTLLGMRGIGMVIGVLPREPDGWNRPQDQPVHRHRAHRRQRSHDGHVRVQRAAVAGRGGGRRPGDRERDDVGAAHHRRLRHPAPQVAPRRRLDLPSPAELRIEHLHLAELHGRGPHREDQLRGAGRAAHSVQRDAPVPVRHRRLDARRPPRAGQARLRGRPAGVDGRIRERLPAVRGGYASRPCRCCWRCGSGAVDSKGRR